MCLNDSVISFDLGSAAVHLDRTGFGRECCGSTCPLLLRVCCLSLLLRPCAIEHGFDVQC